MEGQLRIDKWLWAVRIFKTRSLAAENCKKGKIFINNVPAKASRIVKPGDKVVFHRSPAIFTYRVISLTGKRVAAKFTADYMEDLTPQDEKDKLLKPRLPDFGHREKGFGRPTKKERRTIDRFRNLKN